MQLPAVKDQKPPDEVLIAESILPYMLGDSRKSLYLSYRACGFSTREAQDLAGVSQRSVLRWRRRDPEFKAADTTKLPQIRKQLGADFTQLEFLRNFRLLLKKDFEVIMKFVKGLTLTKTEESYIQQMRKLYSPQQLEVLHRVLSGGGSPQSFSFTQLVINLAKQRQEGQLSEEPIEAEFRDAES